MSGAMNMAGGLGGAAMAFGGGYVIARAGFRPLFLAGACTMAAGALIFYVYFRLPRGELASTPRALT
jgi:hypothetical protein